MRTAARVPTNPDSLPERRLARAQGYLAQGQYAAARATLETVLVSAPRHARAQVLLATVDLAQHHLRDSCARLRRVVAMLPDDAELIGTVAFCLHKVGETVAMHDCLGHPEVARTRSGPALLQLAHMYKLLGLHPQALALSDRALSCGLDSPELLYQRALELQFNGRTAECEKALAACIALYPGHGRATYELVRLHQQTPTANPLQRIAAQLDHVQPGTEQHASFEFARFKTLDDLGQYPAAWDALARANAIMSARVTRDVAGGAHHFDAIARICTTDFVSAGSMDQDAGPAPIFIVGMPRSGTTLLERIVSNHSQVASCGELQDFAWQMRWAADVDGRAFVDDALLARAAGLDYAEIGRRYLAQTRWRAAGRPYFVDKLPLNFLLAGFIHRALPAARILHVVRNPMDVCFSNWKAMFGAMYGYSYRLPDLAAYYCAYRALMDHWHRVMPNAILDVRYADLVAAPERAAARVFAFCGLPFEAGCSDLTRNRQPVATLSAAQVQAKIATPTTASWQRYADRLQPLQAAIDGTGCAGA